MKITKILHSFKKKTKKNSPHLSFRKTNKRDYIKPVSLPGYFSFTKHVAVILLGNKKLFIYSTIFYSVLTILMIGFYSQDNYASLLDTLKSSSTDFIGSFISNATSTGTIFLTAITGGLSVELSDIQQVYYAIITLFTWLVTVWLLRNIMAGRKVKFRDGLYNAGSPIISTFMVILLALIQCIPIALAVVGYVAAVSTGFLDSGIEAMIFWVVVGLLILLSVYWLTSTLFALIIVTIPGFYPLAAIKSAGEIVNGQRLRFILRFVWLALTIFIGWLIVIVPIVLIDSWLKGIFSTISFLPIVPITILVLGSMTMIWSSSYIYLLYRKVVYNELSKN